MLFWGLTGWAAGRRNGNTESLSLRPSAGGTQVNDGETVASWSTRLKVMKWRSPVAWKRLRPSGMGLPWKWAGSVCAFGRRPTRRSKTGMIGGACGRTHAGYVPLVSIGSISSSTSAALPSAPDDRLRIRSTVPTALRKQGWIWTSSNTASCGSANEYAVLLPPAPPRTKSPMKPIS